MKYFFYLVCMFSVFAVPAQDPKVTIHTSSNDPLFFIDSAVASRVEMEKLNPREILPVSVYKDKGITALARTEARYGIVYIIMRITFIF
jgi:hypothetical protein